MLLSTASSWPNYQSLVLTNVALLAIHAVLAYLAVPSMPCTCHALLCLLKSLLCHAMLDYGLLVLTGISCLLV
jgi:hypothetical protein